MRRSGFGLVLFLLAALLAAYLLATRLRSPSVSPADPSSGLTSENAVQQAQDAVDALNGRMNAYTVPDP
ncbi:MAG: hypothetical protein K6C08_00260 [Oscillospiraceae bacterium]|nr:hypothetical protein [Oscillospiraceae bacterium]